MRKVVMKLIDIARQLWAKVRGRAADPKPVSVPKPIPYTRPAVLRPGPSAAPVRPAQSAGRTDRNPCGDREPHLTPGPQTAAVVEPVFDPLPMYIAGAAAPVHVPPAPAPEPPPSPPASYDPGPSSAPSYDPPGTGDFSGSSGSGGGCGDF